MSLKFSALISMDWAMWSSLQSFKAPLWLKYILYHHITFWLATWYTRTKWWWIHLGTIQKWENRASKVLKGDLVQLNSPVPGRGEAERCMTFSSTVILPSSNHGPINILKCYKSDFYSSWGERTSKKKEFLPYPYYWELGQSIWIFESFNIFDKIVSQKYCTNFPTHLHCTKMSFSLHHHYTLYS